MADSIDLLSDYLLDLPWRVFTTDQYFRKGVVKVSFYLPPRGRGITTKEAYEVLLPFRVAVSAARGGPREIESCWIYEVLRKRLAVLRMQYLLPTESS